MIVETHVGPRDFLQRTSEYLYLNETVHNLILGLAHFLEANPRNSVPAPLFISAVENGQVVGAALMMPQQNLVLSLMSPQVVEAFATHLIRSRAVIKGVVATPDEAIHFKQLWEDKTQSRSILSMSQKLYQVSAVFPPTGVGGTMKVAEKSDIPLLQQWFIEFSKESLPNEPKNFDVALSLAEHSVEQLQTHLWIDQGKPVSMAQSGRATHNAVAVRTVYTPVEHRKKGYASAVTATLSNKLLDSGKKYCVLYTDMANPTSNRIYQKIGYEEVCQSRHFLFKKK